MKIDILVPTKNGLSDSVQMLDSLQRTTSRYRLTVIDSESTDGTPEFFESQNIRVLRVRDRGFGHAINAGLEVVESDVLVLLNNDVVLPEGWLEGLIDTRERSGKNTGFVGPVSNYAKKHQKVSVPEGGSLEDFSRKHRSEHAGVIAEVGTLGFFCTLLDSEMMRSVGGLEEWGPGGHEDDDYIVRAWELGWKAVISGEVFVFHRGGQTFQREFGSQDRVFDNRFRYYEKHYREKPTIVAIYRVHNDRDNFIDSLERTSKQVDLIYVFDDRSDPPLREIIEHFPKVKRYHYKDPGGEFDEYADRMELLRWLERSGCDWALALDSDEQLEEYVTFQKLHDLVRVPDPSIRQIIFPEITFWNRTHYRNDGLWADMTRGKLFRIGPGMSLRRHGNIQSLPGLHCSSFPLYPEDCRRVTTLRILHHGYNSEEQRERKFEFYEKGDQEKNVDWIGAPDYSHLRDESRMLLVKYVPGIHASLNILARPTEFPDLSQVLLDSWGAFQERLVHLDWCPITPEIEQLKKLFQVKIVLGKCKDFSAKRNLLLSQSQEDWIFSLDTDERFEGWPILRKLLDFPTNAWMFWVQNLRKDGRYSITERVRLFHLDNRVRWSGAIHEHIEVLGAVSVSPVGIVHFGFLKEENFLQEKLREYEAKIRAGLEKNPNDPVLLFSLALHLREKGEDGVVELLRKAIQFDPKFLQARTELGLILLRESREHISSAVNIMPDSYPLKQSYQALLRSVDDFTQD